MFVDTANTFRPERVAEIAQANGFDADVVLARVAVFRPRSSLDQLTVTERARGLARAERLLLLVVDPITDLFLQDYQGDEHLMSRQSALARHVHALALHALHDQIAVMVTNGVRMRPREGTAEIAASMLRSVHVRVQLSRQGLYREARTTRRDRIDTARFRITQAGLSD
jgi:RecA/RadA recombinase